MLRGLLPAADRARLVELALCVPNRDVFGMIADEMLRRAADYDAERMRRHLAAVCGCVVMHGGGCLFQVWGSDTEFRHALRAVGRPIIGMTFRSLPPSSYDPNRPLLHMVHEHAPESVTFVFKRGWSVALSRWPREPQAQAAYAVAADTPG